MSLPLKIAWRYLVSKKGHQAVNIISIVAVCGVVVATAALICVLSVFNGFRGLIMGKLAMLDPQVAITASTGKTINNADSIIDLVSAMPGVERAVPVVEDQALAIYGDRQAMVMVKGVDTNFSQLTHFSEILYPDKGKEIELHAGNLDFGIPGIRLAQMLGTGAAWRGFMHIYAPEREGQLDMTNPDAAFVEDSLLSAGNVFSVNQARYDRNYIVTSLSFARNLFGQQGMVSSLELRLKPGSNFDGVKKEIKKIAGEKFQVLDRYEQQADTYKIMSIEKFMAYVFLTFILVVACFNIIGSLSMLIIDKKDDVATLRNLGASNKQISRIFLFEGRMIAAAGAVLGIILGLFLCWLQKTFGLVGLGNSSRSFIIDAYPVSVHFTDILLTFITVIAVGWLAVWYPVNYLSKRLLE